MGNEVKQMTLRDLISKCTAEESNSTIYVNLKDNKGSLVLSADVDRLNELDKLGDDRLNQLVLSWSPAVFTSYTKETYPQLYITLDYDSDKKK